VAISCFDIVLKLNTLHASSYHGYETSVLQGSITDANKGVSVLQCHGDMDPMVPFAWGSMTAQLLKMFNPSHEIVKLSGVMHSSSPQVCVSSKVGAMCEFILYLLLSAELSIC